MLHRDAALSQLAYIHTLYADVTPSTSLLGACIWHAERWEKLVKQWELTAHGEIG